MKVSKIAYIVVSLENIYTSMYGALCRRIELICDLLGGEKEMGKGKMFALS